MLRLQKKTLLPGQQHILWCTAEKTPLPKPCCKKTLLPFIPASTWEIGSKWVLLTPTQELRKSSASEGY